MYSVWKYLKLKYMNMDMSSLVLIVFLSNDLHAAMKKKSSEY